MLKAKRGALSEDSMYRYLLVLVSSRGRIWLGPERTRAGIHEEVRWGTTASGPASGEVDLGQ